ncbi:MAG: glycosyltransferase [Pegethrix bostrychoides GSE-TBD4-15B]|jgi:glycosyltransferase involved in cell wall biosynthesis|uniref:Glycosyltransferase n=1 Tax=Pegethrix bostrychoides GSE-TBD4-15B TaxID=2839662 RepID=A0A951PDC7_9CYAN|nr:glycosyltransferase [Pegethrix bostrychoides GSE-TBD4-15B]
MTQPQVTQPQVSVLMTVYNSARYLAEAVESILNQSFGDFEFLILDDGSQDRSAAILQAYAAQDSRIHLTLRENRGITKSLNELIAQARGELVARMDADDIALPERFARQVAFLQAHPKVVCVGGALDWIDARSQLIGHCPMPQTDAELQRHMLTGVSLLHHPTAMLRRDALLQVGGYDETMLTSSDLDLWLRLGEVGQLANLSDTVLQYRLHSDSITQAKQSRQAADALAACQRAWQRRGIQGEFQRPPADHLKQHQFWLRCGWNGFLAGERDVARRCGLRAIATAPLNLEAWKLLACAVVKPIPMQA